MQIIVDMPDSIYERLPEVQLGSITSGRILDWVQQGIPLKISKDGTLIVTVDDYLKVKRVLVQDKNKWGGMFYADSD